MMYIHDVKCMSSLFKLLVQQLCVGRGFDSYICGDAFVGTVDPFISAELRLSGTAAAGFAEKLQRTIANIIGSVSYY